MQFLIKITSWLSVLFTHKRIFTYSRCVWVVSILSVFLPDGNVQRKRLSFDPSPRSKILTTPPFHQRTSYSPTDRQMTSPPPPSLPSKPPYTTSNLLQTAKFKHTLSSYLYLLSTWVKEKSQGLLFYSLCFISLLASSATFGSMMGNTQASDRWLLSGL